MVGLIEVRIPTDLIEHKTKSITLHRFDHGVNRNAIHSMEMIFFPFLIGKHGTEEYTTPFTMAP